MKKVKRKNKEKLKRDSKKRKFVPRHIHHSVQEEGFSSEVTMKLKKNKREVEEEVMTQPNILL